MTHVLFLLIFTKVILTSAQLNTTECNKSKTCFVDPPGCSLEHDECAMIAAFAPPIAGSTVEFELEVKITPPTNKPYYGAIGLSTTNKMGDSFIIACVNSAYLTNYGSNYDSDKIRIGTTVGMTYTELSQDHKKMILAQYLTPPSSSVKDGVLYCRFIIGITPPTSTAGWPLSPPDLTKKFHVLMAMGLTADNLDLKHHNTRAASPQYSFEDSSTVTNPTDSLLDISTCGVAKGCVRKPENCTALTACESVVSYASVPNDPSIVAFEMAVSLTGNALTDGQYVAIGFSKDEKMGNDPVTACVYSNESSRSVGLFFNGGKSNKAIQGASDLISNVSITVEDDFLICKYNQKKNPGPISNVYSSADEPYHLLLATGNAPATNKLKKHETGLKNDPRYPYVTPNLVSVSDPLRKVNTPATTEAAPLKTTPARDPPSMDTLKLVDFSGCGVTKSCIREPSNCDAQNCSYAVTYTPISDSQTIDFEMVVRAEDINSQYIGIGFSDDEKMGSDMTLGCIRYDGKFNIVTGYNIKPPGFSTKTIDGNQNLITSRGVGQEDGLVMCKFRLDASKAISTPVGDFDLGTAKYHMLIATGPPAGLSRMGKHSTTPGPVFPVATKSMINFNKIESLSVTSGGSSLSGKLVKAHGIMMIFGWFIFVASAILFARYFRRLWPDKKPFDIAIWFHCHRAFNIIGLLLIVAAFICIFVARDGVWVGYKSFARYHSILGITCTILALIQPFMAIFRCHPGTAKRPIFNWFHRIVGIGAWCIAAATIWFATDIPMVGIYRGGYRGIAPRIIMIVYWAILGVVAIALEIHVTIVERLPNKDEYTDYQLEPVGKGPDHYSRPSRGKSYTPMWARIRSILFAIFVICSIALTVALAYMIGIH